MIKILKIKECRDKNMELNYTKIGDYLLGLSVNYKLAVSKL